MTIYQRARQMRLKPTGAEAQLRRILHEMGIRRIRRQIVIGTMIVDIAVPERCLLIEVDGAVHEETRGKDRRRDGWLRSLGFHVLRLPNEQVLNNPDIIFEKVASFRPTTDARARFRTACATGRRYEQPERVIAVESKTPPKITSYRLQCDRCQEWKLARYFTASDGRDRPICEQCALLAEEEDFS